jgi:hypothetical protein
MEELRYDIELYFLSFDNGLEHRIDMQHATVELFLEKVLKHCELNGLDPEKLEPFAIDKILRR